MATVQDVEDALNDAARSIAIQKNLPLTRAVRLDADLRHDLEIHKEKDVIEMHPSLSAEKMLKRLTRGVELAYEVDNCRTIHEGVSVGRRA